MLYSPCPDFTVASCYLLLCLPTAANFYILVPQDVVTVVVVLEVYRDHAAKNIPTEASAHTCFYYLVCCILLMIQGDNQCYNQRLFILRTQNRKFKEMDEIMLL